MCHRRAAEEEDEWRGGDDGSRSLALGWRGGGVRSVQFYLVISIRFMAAQCTALAQCGENGSICPYCAVDLTVAFSPGSQSAA